MTKRGFSARSEVHYFHTNVRCTVLSKSTALFLNNCTSAEIDHKNVYFSFVETIPLTQTRTKSIIKITLDMSSDIFE